MLETFAFDVCHHVYRAAREAIDSKIPTLNAEASGKYQWHPDRLPRLAEYICDFACAGERALEGCGSRSAIRGLRATAAARSNGNRRQAGVEDFGAAGASPTVASRSNGNRQAEACPTRAFRASRRAMFRVYYLGGAEYPAARRHLGISELTWADWADEIRRVVGRELLRAGLFPPSRYFRESTVKNEGAEEDSEGARFGALRRASA